MATFLNSFPKIIYDINRSKPASYESVTNIFFRLSVIKEVLENTAAYYVYTIKEMDRPETLADNIYKDPDAYWIILYANDMIDPQYDWPLNYRDFENYIINKYGSIAAAQSTPHHYEKVINRKFGIDEVGTNTRLIIDGDKLTTSVPSYYDYYAGMSVDAESETVTVAGQTVQESITRQEINCYDYEVEQNERKRNIKIIKPEYYPQIISEFNSLTRVNELSFVRRLI